MARLDCQWLRTHPAFWSRLGFHYDPPRFGKDGKIIRLFRSFEEQETIHREMYEAGIRLHSSILFSGWSGVGRFDYELTDRTLESIFSCGKDILYIPRVKLNVPVDWCAAFPEDVCVYYDGPRDAESIRARVGTPQQDMLGYNSQIGYTVPDGVFTDDRPNVNGLIALQSLSSQRWLADASAALRRLIAHIQRETPYADRIPAWHFAYGPCGETSLWGQWSYLPVPGCDYRPRCGDYGIAHTRNFYNWALAHYSSLNGLRDAWRMPELDETTFQVPPPELREGAGDTVAELFRCGGNRQAVIDYERFMEDTQVQAMNQFGNLIHQTTGRCAGAFAGYFIDAPRSNYSGNGATGVLNRATAVDFFAGPKSYYRNGIGEAGGEQSAAQSVNLQHLWMDEIDNGTHLDVERSHCRCFEESCYLMWREVAKNLAHGSGFWWMDLGQHWYHDPQLLAEIRRINRATAEVLRRPGRSTASILLIADDSMLTRVRANFELHEQLLRASIREAALIGSGVDLFRLDDLAVLDCSQYKLVIFLNAFHIRAHTAELIRTRLAGALKIWQYAPGFQGGAEYLPFTCIPARQVPGQAFPAFTIRETADVEILKRDADGQPLLGRAGLNLYSAVPALPALELRHWAEISGCRMDALCGDIVYGDNRFLAIFRGRNPSCTARDATWFRPGIHEWISDTELTEKQNFRWGEHATDCIFLTGV